MAAMTPDQEMSMSELTRQALLELEGTVSHNRAKGYIARSQVSFLPSRAEISHFTIMSPHSLLERTSPISPS